MTLKAALPWTTRSTACCQESPAASLLAQSSTRPKTSQARTALGSVNLSLPFQRLFQSSGPRTARATLSQRCCCVQFSPRARGASRPFCFRVWQVARNSSQVRGGLTPHSLSLAGRYHITLERWMFTGTLQIPPL